MSNNIYYGQPLTLGGGDPDLQEKTISPTLNEQIITPDADYDGLSKVTIGAMPSATQASPAITVSSSGLITATSTQSEGYVVAGTKSATQQLTTQAAKTITPSTSNQTAIAAGSYATGVVTVKGDANLKAANIVKGVSIFGVTGSAASDLINFNYTGNALIRNSSDYGLSGDYTVLALITSGTLTLPKTTALDVFVVGGGGGGSQDDAMIFRGGGGGGGYTTTKKNVSFTGNTGYSVVIGAGGAVKGNGGQSSINNIKATGGYAPASPHNGGNGGSGGGGYGCTGGSNGSDGSSDTNYTGGTGQGTTTRAFSESSAILFAGGGGGGNAAGGDGGGGKGGSGNYSYNIVNGTAGAANTGGGGGGSTSASSANHGYPAAGGSGVILLRIAR